MAQNLTPTGPAGGNTGSGTSSYPLQKTNVGPRNAPGSNLGDDDLTPDHLDGVNFSSLESASGTGSIDQSRPAGVYEGWERINPA